LPELLDQALDGELAVSELAPLVLGDRSQDGADAPDHAPLLHVRQAL